MRNLLLAALLLIGLRMTAQAQDNNVTVYQVEEGNLTYLVAKMTNCSEAVITITATMENVVSSAPMPLTVEVTGQTPVTLAAFKPVDPAARWNFTWQYNWKPGHRLQGRIGSYTYSLPYKTGAHQVIQGAHGAFSHYEGTQQEEAIDFAMPVGTTVYPARAGIVVGLHSEYAEGGPDTRLVYRTNYLIIKHDDGTYAEYLHLQKNGVLVQLGDRATLDKPIALSGNTGYTNAPHLHFAVFYPQNGFTRTTLPVVFKSRGGVTIRLDEGNIY